MCRTEQQKLTQHCPSAIVVAQPLGGQTQFCLAETLARSARGDSTTVKKKVIYLKHFFFYFLELKKISLKYSWLLKLKLQSFGHLMLRPDSLVKT